MLAASAMQPAQMAALNYSNPEQNRSFAVQPFERGEPGVRTEIPLSGTRLYLHVWHVWLVGLVNPGRAS
jgi:hypothetical protein